MGGTLDIRVIGVEVLEQTRTHVVTADGHVADRLAELVGEHETRVDDLTLLGVTNGFTVHIASDRILDRSEHLDDGPHLVVVEFGGQPNTHHRVMPQQLAQPRRDRGVSAMDRRIEAVNLDRRELSLDRQCNEADGVTGHRPIV